MQLRRVFLVARRDYLAIVGTKGFLVGLVAFPILCGSGLLFMPLLKAKPDLADRRVAVIDRTAVVAAPFLEAARAKTAKEAFTKAGTQVAARYVFETIVPDDRDANAQRLGLSDRVRSHDLYAFLEIGAGVVEPDRAARKDDPAGRMAYYGNASGLEEARNWFDAPLITAIQHVRLAKAGVAADSFQSILERVPVERLTLLTRDQKTGAIQKARKTNALEGLAAPFGLTMLLSMVVMIGASPVMAAVIEDRSQRIVEMLLGLTTPYELMMGKVVAAVGVSLTSSAFYIAGGTLALFGLGLAGMIPFSLMGWFFVYLLADVMMLCALAAAVGSPCNSVQEAQSVSVLLFLPMIGPFMLLAPVIQQPNGIVATVASMIPPFTPLLMLLRQAMPGGVPAWQPWVALIGVILWTLFTVGAAARIFRVGILMQGKSPRLPDLIRWAVRG